MSKFFKVVFCSKCLEPGYKKIIKIEEKVKVSLNKEEIIRSKPIEDKMICKQCGNSSLIEIRGIKTEHIAEVIVFSVISNKYFKTANLILTDLSEIKEIEETKDEFEKVLKTIIMLFKHFTPSGLLYNLDLKLVYEKIGKVKDKKLIDDFLKVLKYVFKNKINSINYETEKFK